MTSPHAASPSAPAVPARTGLRPPHQPTWAGLERWAREALAASGVDNGAMEARWMLEVVSGREGPELVAAATAGDRPPGRVVSRLLDMLARRAAGEPLQYVLGRWSFRGIDVMVDRRVLIPRPETEVVAGHAIAQARRVEARTAADLGTGAGVIAMALAAELASVEVWASDVSTEALAVARANLAGLGRAAARVRLVHGSWFDALPAHLAGRIDVMVSNPPYVGEAEVAALPSEVRDHEPQAALISGLTGLEALSEVISGAPAWLSPVGVLVCEIAPHQGDAVVARAHDAGFVSTALRPDLGGRCRVLLASLEPDAGIGGEATDVTQ